MKFYAKVGKYAESENDNTGHISCVRLKAVRPMFAGLFFLFEFNVFNPPEINNTKPVDKTAFIASKLD